MIPLIQPVRVDMGTSSPHRWHHIADVYAELWLLPRDVALDGFLHDPDPSVSRATFKATSPSRAQGYCLNRLPLHRAAAQPDPALTSRETPERGAPDAHSAERWCRCNAATAPGFWASLSAGLSTFGGEEVSLGNIIPEHARRTVVFKARRAGDTLF